MCRVSGEIASTYLNGVCSVIDDVFVLKKREDETNKAQMRKRKRHFGPHNHVSSASSAIACFSLVVFATDCQLPFRHDRSLLGDFPVTGGFFRDEILTRGSF